MPDRKNFATNLVISTIGIGLFYAIMGNLPRIWRKLQLLCKYRNPLRHPNVKIVENLEECHAIIKTLQKHCEEYRVLGFDCEWIGGNGTRHPVALLQLASHEGLCALIRLSKLGCIPRSLREILENGRILKVGIAPLDDVNKLAYDYGVSVISTLDLRYLTLGTKYQPGGLAKLSKSVLNVELDKHWTIRCSNWESEILSERQIQYAAKDALVAIEMFKKLSKEIKPRNSWLKNLFIVDRDFDFCDKFVDISFKDKMFSGMTPISSTSTSVLQKNISNGFKNPSGRGLCTRTKKLYDNCLLEAPDGEILCTCDKKKANWYIYQDLGELISEDPYTVRLKFEPAGRAVGEVGKYYTLAKANQCVVCGREDAYIRKNVVPREYRKHFPVVMKSHTSHDVLLLCPHCHQISNASDFKIRARLAEICKAPLSRDGQNAKYIEIPKLRQLKCAARALIYNVNKIPPERQRQLEEVVLNNYPEELFITPKLLKKAATIDIMERVENYCSHGLKVVNEFKNNLGGLVELEIIWRQHFLETMHPKYLPELWSVTHSTHRLEIRANEGRIEKHDMEIAGLDAEIAIK